MKRKQIIDLCLLDHPRNINGLRLFLCCCLFLCATIPLHATHLVGGNLRYESLGSPSANVFRYKIIFKTYQDCSSPFWGTAFPRPDLDIGVYEVPKNNPNGPFPRLTEVTIPLIDSNKIEPVVSDSCAVGSTVCIYEVTYIDSVDITFNSNVESYYLHFSECCRNNDVINLNNPGGQGMTFRAWIPSLFIDNSSPVFSDISTPFICTNDTATILNTAFDPDGDKLDLSFVHPTDGNNGNPNPIQWPPDSAVYQLPHTFQQPFGPSGYAKIDKITGLTKYYATTPGQYVISVEVEEYFRLPNGTDELHGLSYRDLQIIAINCPANPDPVLSMQGGSGNVNVTIEEGESLCFPITFTDVDGDSLFMSFAGDIFDTTLVNPAATLTAVQGDSIISSQFCWNTACGQGRPLPYLFTVSVRDNGCPSKTSNVVYSITVNPFEPVDTILGPTSSCAQAQGVGYSVNGTGGSTFDWIITGGTQASGGTTSNITIDWGNGPSGQIKVVETSQFLCGASDTVTLNISITSPTKPEAGASAQICGKGNAQFFGTPLAGYTYSWSPSNNLNDATIINPFIVDSSTTNTCDTIYYILTATHTASGCGLTDTTFLVICPDPIADAGFDQYICEDTTFQLSGTEQSGILNPSFSWTPVADATQHLDSYNVAFPNGVIHYASLPDTFEYILNVDVQGCTDKDSMLIIGTNNPSVNVMHSPDTICIGAPVVLEMSGTQFYAWTTITNPGPFSTDDSVTVNPTSTTTYIANASDSFGCRATADTFTIVVNQLPNVTALANPDTICRFDNTMLSASGAQTYTWAIDTAPGTVVNATQSWSLSPDSTTGYIVTGIDTNGCVNTATTSIHVNQLPNVVATINPAIICLNDSTNLMAAGADTYWWGTTATPNDTISEAVTFNHAPTTNTSYILTGTDVNGCVEDDTVSVTVNPLPVFTTSVTPDTICHLDSATLGVVGTDSYWWANTLTPGDTLSTLTAVNVAPDSSSTYILTATTANNCVLTDTIALHVNPKPVMDSLLGSPYVCPGVTGVSYWVMDNSPGMTYHWTVSGGSITFGAGTDSILVNWGGSGNAFVEVVEENVFGCLSDTLRMPITVNENLSPFVNTGDTAMCEDDRLGKLYTAIFTNGSTYDWGVLGGAFVNGDTTSMVTVDWSVIGIDAGAIWFQETSITDSAVCTGVSDTLYIDVHPLPVINQINGVLRVCAYDTAVYSVVNDPNTIYNWTVDSGTIVSGDSTNMIVVAWPGPGSYTVEVQPTSDFGCVGSTAGITVNVTPLPTTTSITGDTVVCSPDHVGLEYVADGLAGSTFTWTITGGTIVSGDGTDRVTVDWDGITGFGTLTVSEMTQDSCYSDTYDLTIVLDAPTIQIDYATDQENNEKDVEVQWQITDGDNFNGNYVLSRKDYPGGVWAQIVTQPQNLYVDAGLETSAKAFQYQVVFENNCGNDVTSTPHNTVLLKGTNDEDAKTVSLEWNGYHNWPGGVDHYEIWRKMDEATTYTYYQDVGTDTSVVLENGKDGFRHCYRIVAVESGGGLANSWSNTICLDFQHLIEIPSAFSPNDDGVNDTWGIRNIDLYPNNTVEIFNRWGNRVFGPHTGYVNDFDGTRNGKDMPESTYYYIINLNLGGNSNENGIYNGSVTIIR